jgi:tetratricopeptide (TPR) repeat protein
MEALNSYDRALQQDPRRSQIWVQRGLVLMDLNLYGLAIQSFDRALQMDPDDAEAHYAKACCCAWEGQVPQALQALEQALRLQPERYRPLLASEPYFDLIRGEPSFTAFLTALSGLGTDTNSTSLTRTAPSSAS